MRFDLNKDLQTYFTDVEHLRNTFKKSVAAQSLTKRLLIIHGVGGVGKSSLLKMFCLHCKSIKVPVALASGDEAKSALDVLRCWADDLKVDGVKLPTFGKTFDHYRAIQAKVNEQSIKMQNAPGYVANIATKAASKTVEMVVGAAISSVIPGIGTAVGAFSGILGGVGAEALVDWLRGRGFAKADIDLLLDPTKRLTDDFLADIKKIALKRRVVLIFDTFEKMTTLEDWMCDLAERLHQNILFVVAGHGVPNWDRRWTGWLAQADVEELELMTPSVMRKLLQRYYKKLTDCELDITQAEGIILFARGLPLAITSAVDLMVKYHAKNFQAITPKVTNDLADRLQEGVPNDLKPVLQAAATLRWFDEPTLRAVMQKSDVSTDYDKLQHFPFVIMHDEFFAIHDVVREKLDANFRTRDSERHIDWHERAAKYFERRMEKATGEEFWRMGLERLYHRVCGDEENGIHLFQMMSEELVQFRLFNRLRTLLNDVNTYPLEKENSKLWREYYFALLISHEGPPQLNEAEKIYEKIIRKTHEDSFLRAKTLLHWIDILDREDHKQPDTSARVVSLLKECEKLLPEDDWERYLLLIRKSVVFQASFHDIYTALMEVIDFCISRNDYYALASTCQWVKGYAAMHGRWREFLDIEQKVVNLPKVNANPMLNAKTFSDWQVARIWMGRYAETERILREVIDIQTIGVKKQDDINRDLLYAIEVQGRISEVVPLLERMRDKYYVLGQNTSNDLAWVLRLLGIAHLWTNDTANAKKYLSEAVKIVSGFSDPYNVHADAYFLGFCCLARHEWQEANECFSKYVRLPFDDWHLYFKSGALVGLVQVKEATGKEEEIPSLLVAAESLAQQNEYNDHLAFLRLMQGHIAWKRETDDDSKEFDDLTSFEVVLRYYQHALIFALRYNRFLLDEVLWGGNVGTHLVPIISRCRENSGNPKARENSWRMLVALREWWMIGINDIGISRQDTTISAIPEGISLLEAENLARKLEPGDGLPQKSVLDQIEAFLESNYAD